MPSFRTTTLKLIRKPSRRSGPRVAVNLDGSPDDPAGQLLIFFGNRCVLDLFFSFVLFVSFVVPVS
jgi:hypothetical protein